MFGHVITSSINLYSSTNCFIANSYDAELAGEGRGSVGGRGELDYVLQYN